jgi:hypothetical protein
VSREVWEKDAWPRRLERHSIPDPQFSGWFVLEGDESDDFKADFTNTRSFPRRPYSRASRSWTPDSRVR